jgi:hypothetical protein
MIFSSHRQTGGFCAALKNRYLPMLNTDVKFTKSSLKPNNAWSKEKLHALITGNVILWMKHHLVRKGQGITDNVFCKWVSANQGESGFSLDEIVSATESMWKQDNTLEQKEPFNFKTEITNTLTRANTTSLMEYKKTGSKRLRRWFQMPICVDGTITLPDKTNDNLAGYMNL